MISSRVTATTTNPPLFRRSSNHSYQHLRIRASPTIIRFSSTKCSSFPFFLRLFPPGIVSSDKLRFGEYDNCTKQLPFVLTIKTRRIATRSVYCLRFEYTGQHDFVAEDLMNDLDITSHAEFEYVICFSTPHSF